MSTEIKAPSFPESVADGTIATWHKKPGERVSRDELLVDIETDKVVLEVLAPADGAVAEIIREEGDTVNSEEVIGTFEKGEGEPAEDKQGAEAEKAENKEEKPSEAEEKKPNEEAVEAKLSPAARKLIEEKELDADAIEATGKGNLVTKEDVLNYLEQEQAGAKAEKPPADKTEQHAEGKVAREQAEAPAPQSGERIEKRVAMTRLRKRIAERLLDASQNTAMLTTFNEVDMSAVMALRKKYKEQFEKAHDGIRLGFMGFFVKAACEALKRFPAVNASIDGDDIVYHAYQDVGVAVSTDKGLVVPVLRDADQQSLAVIEDKIRDFGLRARDGKLSIEEMQGGTFTITNGGVFGSLMSTPILNPPQAAILGMHKIQERPMAINGQVAIRPMMYLALSYDHRLIDGREAVQFLVAIKDLLEDPARILLEV